MSLKPAIVVPSEGRAWLGPRRAAVLALVAGVLALVGGLVFTRDLAAPDLPVCLPLLGAVVGFASVSLARREPQGHVLWVPGLALGIGSLFLGWFLLLALIAAGTVLLLVVLHLVL